MKRLQYTLFIFFLPIFLTAQSVISLKDIYQDGKFKEKNVTNLQFHPDGQHFTRHAGQQIHLYNMGDGQKTDVLFEAPENIILDDYKLDTKGGLILIQANAEKIYRHSQQADFLVYNIQSQTLKPIWEEGKQRYASFNPDGSKAAFIFQNNLFYKDLQTNSITQVTEDGQQNQIINGAADWVYEEEFGLTRAYAWSPDGQYLAYLRFDETAVPDFTMMNYHGGVYPEYVSWKYPKVGQSMATVTAFIYNLKNGKSQEINLPGDDLVYLPRIGWSPDGQVYLYKMNRHQNQLELWMADAKTGLAQKILTEIDPAYVKLHDNLAFLPQNRGFLWTSERDGWNHIYHYNQQGRLVEQLTRGEWEVSKIIGFDAATDLIYYQSTEKSPLERHIYSIEADGNGKTILSNGEGWHDVQLSPDFSQILLSHSTINTPPTYGIYTNKGNLRYWLEENKTVGALKRWNKAAPVDFWTFKIKTGETLNGWMIKPPDFQKNQRYPVLMYVYGGPGSQRVANRWNAMRDYWWLQMMAQNGYIIACVDNRGTGGRGAEFQKQTYLNLGQYETQDQIEAAHYLADQSYVDPTRISIYGKSYGGYMASMCLLQGGEVFSAGIALAPVTHWQWYDGIYTERYMRTMQENPDGYQTGSPINYANQLTSPLLLVHGLGDDNVHFQHTAELAGALADANKPFDTHFYPNINHSLRGGNTGIHLYTKMTDFLDEHLREANVPSTNDEIRLRGRSFTTPQSKEDMMLKMKRIPKKQKLKHN